MDDKGDIPGQYEAESAHEARRHHTHFKTYGVSAHSVTTALGSGIRELRGIQEYSGLVGQKHLNSVRCNFGQIS